MKNACPFYELDIFTNRKEVSSYFTQHFIGKYSINIYSTINLERINRIKNHRILVDPKVVNYKVLKQLTLEASLKKLFFIIPQAEILEFLKTSETLKSTIVTIPCDTHIFEKDEHKKKKLCHKIKDLSDEEKSILDNLVGKSFLNQKLKQEILIAAKSDIPILLTGESGTGKTFSAKFIHQLSTRNKNNFNVIDMGVVPENLADSILFGCKKGSFTGSVNSEGLIQQSHNGTLFLDEIQNTSLSVQSKLLRFLETGCFRPIGEMNEKQINTRLIIASNESLPQLVEQKKFRLDLYNRISTFTIQLSPLREHLEDIAPLAYEFLKQKSCKITQKAIFALKHYHWPANIRQLEHCLERAFLFCKNNCIDIDDLSFEY